MSTFKVWDRVRVKTGCGWGEFKDGELLTVKSGPEGSIDGGNYYFANREGVLFGNQIELVTTKGDKPVTRRVFKLLKATPTHKAGTLFKEDCEDGTQPYSTFELEGTTDYLKITDRSKVEAAPKWFAEVFKVTPEYMTQAELDQWEAFKKTSKPAKRKYSKRAIKTTK